MPNVIMSHRLRVRNRTTGEWDDIPAIGGGGGNPGSGVVLPSTNAILKGNGSGGAEAAAPGEDYATPAQVGAKYTKPSDGIPETDLAEEVQTKLNRAASDPTISDHNQLTNRDAENAHPMTAITGLSESLSGKQPANLGSGNAGKVLAVMADGSIGAVTPSSSTDITAISGEQILNQSLGTKVQATDFEKTDGYYINGSGTSTQSTSYCYTEYIPVQPGHTYLIRSFGSANAFFGYAFAVYQGDTNKTYIKTVMSTDLEFVTLGGENIALYTTPDNAGFLRLNGSIAQYENNWIQDAMVLRTLDWLNVGVKNLSAESLQAIQAAIGFTKPIPLADLQRTISQDYLESDYDLIHGYTILDYDGSDYSSSSSSITTYIPVTPGETIKYYNYNRKINCGYFYDANKVYVSPMDHHATSDSARDWQMTVPEGVTYARMKVHDSHIDNFYFKQLSNVMIPVPPLLVQNGNIEDGTITEEKLHSGFRPPIPDGYINVSMLSDAVKAYIEEGAGDNPFDNKLLSAVGDSITYGVGASETSKRWADRLVAKLSMNANYENLGISNTTITASNSSDNSITSRILRGGISENADIITVLGGVNDYNQGKALGTFSDALAYYAEHSAWDATNFCGAYCAIIDYIHTSRPDSQLICITPMHYENEMTANAQGKILEDYVKAIREICEYYSVFVIDLYRDLPIDPKNAQQKSRYTSNGVVADGIHPNDAGHEMIAAMVAKRLKYGYIY